MKKVFLFLAIVILLAVAGGAWWLYRSLDSVVASAIRSYGPEITGVPLSLDSVHIDASAGTAEIKGLVLGNPTGFKTAQAAQLGAIKVRLDVASLTSDVVRIQEVLIDAPVVTYEYASGTNNLEQIQRNVSQYLTAHGGNTDNSAQEKKAPGKKLIIDNLVIRGAKAEVSASALNGKTMTVPLADVHLKDIGKKAGGATPAQVAEQVVGALSYGATKATAGIAGVAGSIKSGAAAAGNAIKGLFSK